MHPPGPDTCEPIHDPAAFYLSLLVTVGLVLSYLPQYARIIYFRSSEGIDPMFLLLGSTSSASSFLNILALSWSAVRCCSFLVRTYFSVYRIDCHHILLTSSRAHCFRRPAQPASSPLWACSS